MKTHILYKPSFALVLDLNRKIVRWGSDRVLITDLKGCRVSLLALRSFDLHKPKNGLLFCGGMRDLRHRDIT